jgi:predicted PurR-regulated permease PerM
LPQKTTSATNYLRHAQSLFDAAKKTRVVTVTPPEDVEQLRATIKTGVLAQTIIAIAAAIGLIFFLKTVLITILISMLIAFVLDPMVVVLARIHVPRPIGAFFAMLLLFACAGALTFFFYSRALDFADQIPKYSSSIREIARKFQKEAEKFENTTKMILPDEAGKKPLPVQVKEAPPLTRMITAGATQFGEVALALSFMPFLIYFMLTWKSHVHAATLHIIPEEHRTAGYRTIGRLSEMVRAFIVGNLLVGLISALASTVLFWSVGLPYFYFIGTISAFVGLVPYLGIIFALLAPVAAGLGILTKSQLGIVVFGVVVLHLVSMNLLFPKIIGRRLRLNPLAVALSLLFWAWIWGPAGLVLAVPLMGSTKIICDFIEPMHGLADWLGD